MTSTPVASTDAPGAIGGTGILCGRTAIPPSPLNRPNCAALIGDVRVPILRIVAVSVVVVDLVHRKAAETLVASEVIARSGAPGYARI